MYLKRLIKELHPRDTADAEYDQRLQDLGDMYSDMHKELYRRRPRIPMFKTMEEAESAVDKIWEEYAAFNRAREQQELQDLEYIEMERRIQELMPDEYDIELPTRSGMGRRSENKTMRKITLSEALGLSKPAKKINRKDLQKIILTERLKKKKEMLV